ncbi:cysteine dioxygenase family protein [Roseomonas sp. E05]|uniref:cysteine dioxygenase family protein n=1 Tax=Roseomonas sp. E05 TaxID=3046310 RepID=UPI0024B9A882|nr:cysteine dioxygenase family protein [Roseomonas sp. E05]MDJ0389633.1 cysteine dioxygenase family protein [Roseomonas sp. E05]
MSFIAPRSALDAMLADIAVAARADLAERPRRVAEALGAHVLNPDLLAGRPCPCCPERYIRHLLHADPAGGYAVVALAWRPGQMSPVHAHRTWCAFGVHRGILTEGHYRAGGGGEPMQCGSALRPPGATCHGAADPELIHRLANLGSAEALSIHVYGVPFERFGQDVNLVYAA